MTQSSISSIINGSGGNASFIFNNNDMLWQEWFNNEHKVSQSKYLETIY